MSALFETFEDKDRKYAALSKEIERETAKLEKSDGLAGHPWRLLVAELVSAGRLDAERRKNSEHARAALERFPWHAELELVRGLAFGSDRPVPEHHEGFIEVGAAPEGFPGFPDLTVNEYLWGLDEIAGWQARVGGKRGPEFAGREERDAVRAAEELPAAEAIRVRLLGSSPELSLFAIPELTRRIHIRLVERRRDPSGALALLDQALAFHDSKWNGFSLEVPWTDELLSIARPVHALFTEGNGFLAAFPTAQRLAGVGDVPFMSVQSYAQHAGEFGYGSTDVRHYIGAEGGDPRFLAESAYLARYKLLVELCVYALLAPDVRYPRFLAPFDYPEGRAPTERSATNHDVTRAHALLVWASVGQDPEALADFLHDQLLSLEANAFPQDVSLPVAFTLLVRAQQAELLAGVAERVRAERSDGSGEPGPLERQFSPFPAHLELDGTPTLSALVHSFHTHQAPAGESSRAASRALVHAALGR